MHGIKDFKINWDMSWQKIERYVWWSRFPCSYFQHATLPVLQDPPPPQKTQWHFSPLSLHLEPLACEKSAKNWRSPLYEVFIIGVDIALAISSHVRSQINLSLAENLEALLYDLRVKPGSFSVRLLLLYTCSCLMTAIWPWLQHWLLTKGITKMASDGALIQSAFRDLVIATIATTGSTRYCNTLCRSDFIWRHARIRLYLGDRTEKFPVQGTLKIRHIFQTSAWSSTVVPLPA
jgi:hypothetical protein